MVSKVDTAELEVTQDLLSDFATNSDLNAEDVYRISWSRYQILQQTKIRAVFKDEKFQKWSRIEIYALLPKIIHQFIYFELFTFAGLYRKKSDPRSGLIHFGPHYAHKTKPEFQGDSPKNIKKGINEAVEHLIWNADDPLLQAMHFYQKFVNVHPFYDANGRIGRMIANIYLANHELVLSWKDFDGKGKFVQKLNRTHKLANQETFGYLLDHIRPHLYNLENEDDN